MPPRTSCCPAPTRFPRSSGSWCRNTSVPSPGLPGDGPMFARPTKSIVALVLALLVPLVVAGQGRRPSRQTSATVDYDSHFVFTRIRYGSRLARGFFGGGWAHDYPTADRNLSAILDYITNMRVRMDGSNILDLDDPRVFENPISYM